MSETGGDWRDGAAYDFVDTLAPEQLPFEFLRRNPDYVSEYPGLSTEPDDEGPPPAARALGATISPSIQHPRRNRTDLYGFQLSTRACLFSDLSRRPSFRGPSIEPRSVVRSASEGEYVQIGPLAAPFRALLLPAGQRDHLGVVLPLDTLFDDRLEDVRRWRRWLVRAAGGAASPTAYRRSRLKLALRALDGRAAGAGYREIARGLFPRLVGRDREPSEAVLAGPSGSSATVFG